jgi:hypothetical protein
MATNKIAQDILKAIDSLTTLEIRTIVGDTTRVKNKIQPVEGKSDTIETQINLIDGDITTAMSDKFLSDPLYVPLRDYQAQREQQGHKIVLDNIEALKSLIGLNDTVNTKSQEGANPPN